MRNTNTKKYRFLFAFEHRKLAYKPQAHMRTCIRTNTRSTMDPLIVHNVPGIGNSELHSAIIDRQVKTAIHIISHRKRSIVVPGESGRTPLHLAILHGHTARFVAALVALLPRYSLDFQDDMGNTPLMWAVLSKNPRVVQILLRAQASVYVLNNKGENVLHLACRYASYSCFVALVLHCMAHNIGFDLDLTTKPGATALHYAVEHGSLGVVQWLIENGANQSLEYYFWNRRHYNEACTAHKLAYMLTNSDQNCPIEQMLRPYAQERVSRAKAAYEASLLEDSPVIQQPGDTPADSQPAALLAKKSPLSETPVCIPQRDRKRYRAPNGLSEQRKAGKRCHTDTENIQAVCTVPDKTRAQNVLFEQPVNTASGEQRQAGKRCRSDTENIKAVCTVSEKYQCTSRLFD